MSYDDARIEKLEEETAFLRRACISLVNANVQLTDLLIDQKEGFIKKLEYVDKLYGILQYLSDINFEQI